MPPPSDSDLYIEETAPRTFTLAVTFDGQRFACGTYLSRAEALRAGRLFLARKEGEKGSGKQRRKKK